MDLSIQLIVGWVSLLFWYVQVLDELDHHRAYTPIMDREPSSLLQEEVT